MTKRKEGSDAQLALDLPEAAQPNTVDVSTPNRENPNVVAFVDAATLDVRRDAIRQVRESGIFPAPDGPRLKA